MGYSHILVPTDGSGDADRASEYAIAVAGRYDATVHGLSVVETDGRPAAIDEGMILDIERDRHRDAADAIVEMADAAGLRAEGVVERGRPAVTIGSYAEAHEIDLIAMGTRGARENSSVGSTTLRVARTTDVSVLTVRAEQGGSPDEFETIVVAVDGSDSSMIGAEQAIALAADAGATVRAVYVVDTDTYAYDDVPRSIVGLLREGGEQTLEQVGAMGEEAGVEIKTSLRRGTPSTQVEEYAAATDADLLVVGARGWGGDPHLGSTSERLIRTADRPVLVARES